MSKIMAVPHLHLWPKGGREVFDAFLGSDEQEKAVHARAMLEGNKEAFASLAFSPCICCGTQAGGVDVFVSDTRESPIIAVPFCDACRTKPEACALKDNRTSEIYAEEQGLGHPSTRNTWKTVH